MDLCLYFGTKMCIEDVWGSDITTAAALHLAIATKTKAVMNVCDLAEYVSPHLAIDAPKCHNGQIAPPTGNGLGISIDKDILGKPVAILD